MIGPYLNSWPPPPDHDNGANFSDDGRYRYQLWRCWDRALPLIGFVMLNPSIADDVNPDPTAKRCEGFARRDGFGGFVIGNLSPFVATYPRDLDTAISLGHGTVTGAYQMVTDAMHDADTVLMAWGNLSGRKKLSRPFLANQREGIAAALFKDRPDRDLLCFGRTQDGSPLHPLYLPGDQPITLWRRWDRDYLGGRDDLRGGR